MIMDFPNVQWVTESSHPASGIAYQSAEVNEWPGDPHFVPGTFARVVQNGVTLSGPMRNTTEAWREHSRLIAVALKEMGLPEFQDEHPS